MTISESNHRFEHNLPSRQEVLIQTIIDCALRCENCASECLTHDNVQQYATCIKLSRDCADICSLATKLIHRNSEILQSYLKMCEEICELCKTECAKHEDEEHCQECADACDMCIKMCKEFETTNSEMIVN